MGKWAQQEFPGRTNFLIHFDTLQTAHKTNVKSEANKDSKDI
jgi:hypothetical protein